MASLSDLAKKIRNTVNRQSQAFLRVESLDKDGDSYSIDEVDTSGDTFTVYDVDLSSDNKFTQGYYIYVDGSTGNDRRYEISSVATGDFDNEADTTDSRISVVESVEDSTAAGTIYPDKDYEYTNMGRIMDASFNAESVTSDADQDGRESTQLYDVTVSFTLMQSSNEELSLLPDLAMPDTHGYRFYGNGHYVYFSGDNQTATSDVNAAITNDPDPSLDGTLTFGSSVGQLDDPQGLLFQNVLLNPGTEIDLSGDQGMIPIEFTGRIPLDEVVTLDSDQTITISP